MNRFGFSLALVASLMMAVAHSEPVPKYFVAPDGNDSWSGTRSTPNWTRKDGPFATVQRALTASRDWRKANAGAAVPALVLRGGLYVQTTPLVLTPEDSGLALEAYDNEKPVISGGRVVPNWKESNLNGKRLWTAEIPDVREGKWYFRELWVNGTRAVRARHPNTGYLKVAEAPDKTPEWSQGQMRFRFNKGDLKPSATLTDAEVVVMNRWVESRLPIHAVDEGERLVSFNKRSVFQLEAGDLYYVEGASEYLDQPGEWYLDRALGRLHYLPKQGETLKRAQVIAPCISQVVRIQGRPETNQFVTRVTFRGLGFAHTEWCFPDGFAQASDKPNVWPPPKPEVGGFAQAAVGVPGAVWGEGVRDCVFENCVFLHLGNYGLELTRGCQGNRVARCQFDDLGAGGIKLGETALRSSAAEQTRSNLVSDCRIENGGKMFHSAIGVWLGQTPDNHITHNLIHDFYYTGISVGWTWGYGPAMATNNVVDYNHVHHIGIKSDGDGPILSDMGGIYTLGMQPGTRVSNNWWHDMAGIRYGGWGIYFDEGSSSIIAESNLVYRTTHGGFHQHYGATNQVRNNIFAFARDHQVQRTRVEPHPSFSFVTNIVYFDTGVLLGGNWSGDQYQIDWNDYFDARPGASFDKLKFQDADLEKWHARGHDLHSIFADPLFVAPRADDFTLKSNSPALRLGFQPISLKNVGPRLGSGH